MNIMTNVLKIAQKIKKYIFKKINVQILALKSNLNIIINATIIVQLVLINYTIIKEYAQKQFLIIIILIIMITYIRNVITYAKHVINLETNKKIIVFNALMVINLLMIFFFLKKIVILNAISIIIQMILLNILVLNQMFALWNIINLSQKKINALTNVKKTMSIFMNIIILVQNNAR